MGRKTEKQVENVLKDHNDVTLKAFMVNDLHLSGNELIVFAVVYSFSQDGESWFYGSRKYLASWCQVQVGAIDYQLKKLVDKGLIIKRHERCEDGSVRCLLKANLPLIESMRYQSQKFEGPVLNFYDTPSQKFETGQSQKFMTNNKEEDNKEDTQDIGAEIADIVGYLNLKAGTNYRHQSKQTRKLIHARLAEGFTLDDFKRVIDNKVADWGRDPRMCKYLRPETLFCASKFEGYLNERRGRGGRYVDEELAAYGI